MTRSPLRVRQWNRRLSTVVSIRHTRAITDADAHTLNVAMAAYVEAIAEGDGWYSMDTLPPVGMVIAVTADGRMMFWEAKLLRGAMAPRGQLADHLTFPAWRWRYPPAFPMESA